MELKKLMVDTKSAWMDYPGLEGFSVEVVNLSRKELTALRKRCTTTKFDRKGSFLSKVLELPPRDFVVYVKKNLKGKEKDLQKDLENIWNKFQTK